MSVSTRPASTTRPGFGATSPAVTARAVDLPDPFGPEHGQRLPVGDLEGEVDVALGDHCGQLEGHSALRACRAKPITSTATTTSTSASATAASGSVSRWR